MKIAITGGTGFIGSHLARSLAAQGHSVVIVSRGRDRRNGDPKEWKNTEVAYVGLDDVPLLAKTFQNCDAVAHCAGINREAGDQTYRRVHVDGTRHVVQAAQEAGVRRIALLSFVRARPNSGSPYHESKWNAEEIVRASELDYTILKCGVVHGRGDHLLDHLSHALHTIPIFASVGFHSPPIRPVSVKDVVRLLEVSLVEGRLAKKTVPVLGPEAITLDEIVRRVSAVIRKRVVVFPLPVFAHRILAHLWEILMPIPLVSLAQVRMLEEGMSEPLDSSDELPPDLRPRLRFTEDVIREGLPGRGSFFARKGF